MSRGDEPEPLRPGQRVGEGRYILGEMLGRGGLASVFAAQDRVRGEEVALKVLRVRYVGRAEREERLWRELEYTRRVEHPAIVKVYEGGRLEGRRPFFAMERVQGRPLSQVLLWEGRLPIERVVGLGRALAEALEALHRQGIVHRDVKPANVLVLEAEQRGERIKLLDLGMAGDENAPAVPVGHTGRLTRVADLLGTHEYMAPEQVLKAPPHRAMDVFALGVVLYEMLAGITPYSGMKVREYVELQVDGDPHVRSAARWARLRGAPGELAEIIDACRMREAEGRPAVGVVIERLGRVAEWVTMGRALVVSPARGLVERSRLRESPDVLVAAAPAPVGSATMLRASIGRSGRQPRHWRWQAAVLGVPAVVGIVGWLSHSGGRSGEADLPLAASSVRELSTPHAPSVPSLPVAGPVEEPSVLEAAIEPPSGAAVRHEVGVPSNESPAGGATPSSRRPRPNAAEHCERIRNDANAAVLRRDWAATLRTVAARRCWAEPTERLRLEVRALAQLQRWEACMDAGRGSTDEVVEDWVLLCNHHAHPDSGGA